MQYQPCTLSNVNPLRINTVGARLLLAMCMTLTYPLENYVAKHCLYSMLLRFRRHRRTNSDGRDPSTWILFNDFLPSGFHSIFNFNGKHQPHAIPDNTVDSSQSVQRDDSSYSCASEDELLTVHLNDENLYENRDEGRDGDMVQLNDDSHDDGNPPNGSGVGRIDFSPSENHDAKPTLLEHVCITVGIWGATASIAIFSNDLGVVLALTGKQ